MNSSKIILLIIFILLFFPALILGGTIWSTGSTFNATSPVYINWSNSYNGSLGLFMNSSTVLTVQNSSHTIRINYSQPADGWSYGETSYDASECGIQTSPMAYFSFFVDNGTSRVTSTANDISATMIIDSKKDSVCPPGRYWGMINVTNGTSSNYANVTVIMDLPITSSNSLNTTSGIGQFRGTMNTGDKIYHSYYFNTSEIINATFVAIELGQDLDFFLFDENENFKAKNILGSSEALFYQYLPQNEMWEIRLFDNSSNTDYSGSISFSTLSAKNTTDDIIYLKDFGNMNPSENKTLDIKLKNEGGLIMSSMSELSELYHKQVFDDNTPKNFSIRVPDFATKIRVELNWTNGANYTLKLYKPDGTLLSTSSGKYINANISEVMQEEYVEYSGTVGFSDDGLWKAEVLNNTNITGSFTLTAKEWVNEYGGDSDWIDTNYSTMTFNTTGQANDSTNVEFNFTIQNLTLGGDYEGFLFYMNNPIGKNGLRVPFKVNVTTPELFVNNSFNSSTVTVSENIGANRTIDLNITVNNTGNEDLVLSHSNSSFLNYSTNYMEFSYDAPTNIDADSSALLNITIIIDTTKTGNNQGMYTGWIFLNDTNAHPYDRFNLTLQVGLSSSLNVDINNISTADGDATISNASITENITLKTKVYYANSTAIEDDLNLTNFGSVYLSNKNISHTETISDSNLANTLGDTWHGGSDKQYWINATLTGDSSRPGGYYNVYITANKTNGGQTLSGTGYNGTLIIPGAGLYFTQTDGVFSKYDEVGETDYYEVRVVNYGTVAVLVDDIDLIFTGSDDDECDAVMSDTLNDTTCGSNIVPGETCYYTWKLRLASDTDYVLDCEIRVDTDKNYYGSMPDDSFEVSISDDSGDSGDSDGDDTEDIDITSYPSSISVVQNKSKDFDIEVKNDGDTDEDDIELTITGINSSWYSHSPSNLDLDSGDDDKFEVTISVPEDAEVKEYSITFKVANDDVSDSKTSKLKVMPSEEEKESINETYLIYLENYTTLEDFMKEMMWEGKNVTELNTTLLDIKSKLNSLNQLIENEDYYNAAQKLNEIESLLTTAQSLIEQEELLGVAKIMEEASNYVWLFVGVVIIIIAGFLIYMFMPAPKESYKVKKFKYTSPEAGESIGKKIKKQLKKISVRLKGIKKEKNKKTGYAWKKK